MEVHIWILLCFDDEQNLGRRERSKDKISRVTRVRNIVTRVSSSSRKPLIVEVTRARWKLLECANAENGSYSSKKKSYSSKCWNQKIYWFGSYSSEKIVTRVSGHYLKKDLRQSSQIWKEIKSQRSQINDYSSRKCCYSSKTKEKLNTGKQSWSYSSRL